MIQPDHLRVGRLITLEGGEGAGKSTQAHLLVEALKQHGLTVLLTREPGGAPGAEFLRGLLLSSETDWSPLAETLLHFAARAEHVERTIKPALAAGAWVVCDRFSDSTMAYQGWGQGADRTMIGRLSSMMGVVPDMTLILNVSEAVAAQRRFRRGGLSDRYECQDALFHARVRQGFLSIAASDPARCVLVDADGEPDDVFSAVLLAVRKRLGLALPDPRQ